MYIVGSLVHCGKHWLKSVSKCQQAVLKSMYWLEILLIKRYREQKDTIGILYKMIFWLMLVQTLVIFGNLLANRY